MKLRTNDVTIIALFCAIMCLISPITIPTGTIPFSLSIFLVMLTAISLGAKKGIVAVLVYILTGVLGLPVFSGFTGSIQSLLGPTGGYIISYIFIAGIVGFASNHQNKTKHQKSFLFISCLTSLFVCYLTGSIQYMLFSSISFEKAFISGALIFLPFDIIKAIIAITIGLKIKSKIK